ncbi:MAG TPA: UDP-N-acetylmuramoyl-L-alanine--D-glutamate ligase [Egibacteraceae bacterium]|nr:UDP-N-acetylmuramoyl-L-alanine--D-glutamate ligase [Egibacteraceae bacterium]
MSGFEGLRVLVVGLGVSGAAATRALLAAGADVRATDSGAGPEASSRAAELAAAGAEVRLSDSAPESLLEGREAVVTSPGVPQSAPLLAAAIGSGLPVWSEPELAWRMARGRTRLIAVTGTNGKTTTTQLISACLDAPAAGNIGSPLVEVLSAAEPPPLVVAELSSFQLRFTDTLRAEVGVLLNIADDHLDWHGSPEQYANAKARIWAGQQASDWAVFNREDARASQLAADLPPGAGRAVGFTADSPGPGDIGIADGWVVTRRAAGEPQRVVAIDDLRLTGPHNLANVCAAVAAAQCAGASPDELAAPLAAFEPGPHRLELVAAVGGVDYVNDSKATNPHAAAAALQTFGSVVWIAGGLGKGVSFEPLADLIRERARAVITIGESGPSIAALARRLGVRAVEAGDLATAVSAAAALAAPGDTVLLAPACASMDQFRDYAERGEAFRTAAQRLAHAPAPGAAKGAAR